MFAYTIRRLLQGVVVVLAVIWFTFTLSYFQPDGALAPAYTLCKQHLTQSCLQHYIHQYGLARPYLARLWDYLVAVVVHQDLGVSFVQNNTVSSLLSLYLSLIHI